jgi:O-antigen/teichoic acid export membrane protein
MVLDYNDQPRVEISKRLVIINSVSSILTMAIEVFFNFWLYQYLIRRITPEEYSLLPVVISIMVFFPLLTVFFTAGIGRYIIEAYAKGDEEGVTRIISSIFPFLMLCAILVLGIGGLTAWNVDHILNIPAGRLSDARLMFSLLFITFAYRISALPFQFGFQVKQKFVASNLLTLARTLTTIAILFVLLFSSGVWVVWVVVANTATGVVFITVRLIYSRRILPSLKYRVRMFDFSTAKTVLSFGFWSFLGQSASSLRLAMDPIILNLFATPMDVTCFHIGSSFWRQIIILMGRVFVNLQPAFIAMHSTNQRQSFVNTFHRGNRYFMWLMLFMAMPLMIYRKELISLYVGPNYMVSATVLALLLLDSPLGSGLTMVGRAARAMGRIREITPYAICLELANLALTIYLVRNLQLGAVGSALSTFLVGLFGCLFIWIPISVRLLKISFHDWVNKSFIPGILPAISGGVIWFSLHLWHPPATWFELGTFFSVGAIFYLVALITLGLDKFERRDLRRVLAESSRFFNNTF